jgi:hypothetical protein
VFVQALADHFHVAWLALQARCSQAQKSVLYFNFVTTGVVAANQYLCALAGPSNDLFQFIGRHETLLTQQTEHDPVYAEFEY